MLKKILLSVAGIGAMVVAQNEALDKGFKLVDKVSTETDADNTASGKAATLTAAVVVVGTTMAVFQKLTGCLMEGIWEDEEKEADDNE